MKLRYGNVVGVAWLVTAMLTVWAAHASSAGSAPAAPAAPATPAPTSTPAPVVATEEPPAHDGFVENMDCSACHTADGWKISNAAGASGFDHDVTGFPLRSAHKQSPCQGCHTGAAKPTSTCNSCHRDSHQARLGKQCEECHRATNWQDTQALDRHRRTRLPLTGRHATAECISCHKRGTERTFSDVPADCYACHGPLYQDPNLHPDHNGDVANGVAPFSRDCSQCHSPTTWTTAFTVRPIGLRTRLSKRTNASGAFAAVANMSDRLDHDIYFTISNGKHRAAECESCHSDPRRPKAVRCDNCHQSSALRKQHQQPVSRAPAACLACHPRGGAR